MSHPFDKRANCTCGRCTRERARRAAQTTLQCAPLSLVIAADKRARAATRKQQQAAYLDCGPGAWDDRDLSFD